MFHVQIWISLKKTAVEPRRPVSKMGKHSVTGISSRQYSNLSRWNIELSTRFTLQLFLVTHRPPALRSSPGLPTLIHSLDSNSVELRILPVAIFAEKSFRYRMAVHFQYPLRCRIQAIEIVLIPRPKRNLDQ